MSATRPEIEERQYRVIGTSPSRVDAVDKLVGRAVFGPDVSLPGMLHGKILRSPYAHARIRSIDTSRAEALDGVKAVVTAAHLPLAQDITRRLGEGSVNFRYLSDNTFASAKVLYEGHAVAAVAATSPHIAEEALQLIDVDCEVLEPVVDVRQAMAPDAPLLHEDLYTRSLAGTSKRPSNVASRFRQLKGDPAEGFRQADVIVEREFTTETIHQGYIEPHAATAVWSADGMLTVWATTQGSFAVRDQLSEVLALPQSKIRVIPTEVGGAFGGKNVSFVDAAAALLARESGHPVRVVMSRAEVFLGSGPTSGTYIRIKMGATREGRLIAVEGEFIYEAGAYPGSPVGGAVSTGLAAYDFPNGQADGYDVVVNKPKTGSYRAPGVTPAVYAVEEVVDELAERVSMDPLAFRRLNAAREGTERISGGSHGLIGSLEVIDAALNSDHYRSPLEGPNRGRGVAVGFWGNWGAQSSAALSVNADGTLNLTVGSIDLSGTRTSVAMQVAEALGLPLASIRSTVGDTDTIGYADVSAGSRTTFATGLAALEAARDAIDQMRQRAADLWEVDLDDVAYTDGVFRAVGSGEAMDFAELAGMLGSTGGPITGNGNIDARGWGGSYGAHIVDVEVDPETGKVTILRYTVVQDVGKAIHPTQVEGQLQGGAVMGIGWGLWEGYRYDDQGHLLNPNLLDYKLPTALDVPSIETIMVEVPNPNHPYGVRGVGECPVVPPPGALANAIRRAVGAQMNALPMSPTAILERMGVI